MSQVFLVLSDDLTADGRLPGFPTLAEAVAFVRGADETLVVVRVAAGRTPTRVVYRRYATRYGFEETWEVVAC